MLEQLGDEVLGSHGHRTGNFSTTLMMRRYILFLVGGTQEHQVVHQQLVGEHSNELQIYLSLCACVCTPLNHLFGKGDQVPTLSSSSRRGHAPEESVPRQVDKKSRGPQEDRGLEFSRRREGQTSFFPSTFLSLSHIKRFLL